MGAARQGRPLGVRQLVLIAAGLVGRRYDDLLHRRAPAAGLQPGSGPAGVRLERIERVTVRDGHGGLGGKYEHGCRLVLAKDAFQSGLISHVPSNDAGPFFPFVRTNSD